VNVINGFENLALVGRGQPRVDHVKQGKCGNGPPEPAARTIAHDPGKQIMSDNLALSDMVLFSLRSRGKTVARLVEALEQAGAQFMAGDGRRRRRR
jgi:hypothetical protein